MPCSSGDRRAAMSTGDPRALGTARPPRSRKPQKVASAVLVVTILPILLLVLLFAVTFVSFVQRSGAVWGQVWIYLPFLASLLASVVTWRAMKRAETNRKAWAMCLCTVALLFIAASPPFYSLSKGAAEELCESSPGGRGYSGASYEAPGICDWARS